MHKALVVAASVAVLVVLAAAGIAEEEKSAASDIKPAAEMGKKIDIMPWVVYPDKNGDPYYMTPEIRKVRRGTRILFENASKKKITIRPNVDEGTLVFIEFNETTLNPGDVEYRTVHPAAPKGTIDFLTDPPLSKLAGSQPGPRMDNDG